jgi:hypothetical protein
MQINRASLFLTEHTLRKAMQTTVNSVTTSQKGLLTILYYYKGV